AISHFEVIENASLSSRAVPKISRRKGYCQEPENEHSLGRRIDLANQWMCVRNLYQTIVEIFK
ncbi:hypothetical protein, partial [Pseudomonas sp.]|uniref:hypothetical protein n=1 Tax=Pseudomonas sp. TaxID=306 RepID=UPI0026387873